MSAVTVGSPEANTSAPRKALFGASLGFFVDLFDIYLPVIALTPAIAYFQPKGWSPAANATLFYIVFAITLIGRPIGAFIFGHFADRLGRKRCAIVAVSGFGVASLLIALLPGFEQWGALSLFLLIVIRLVDGIFLGGEYTAASSLAMEVCPREKRGLYGAIIQAGYPIAYVAISLLTAGMLQVAPAGGLHSPYVQWGWRIPFIAGAFLSLVFVMYYRNVSESHVWENSEKAASPLRELFRGKNLRDFLQVFVLMSGMWFSLQAVVSTLPSVLIGIMHVPTKLVTIGLLLANAVMFLGYIATGTISQRVGRKPVFVVMGLLASTVAAWLYYLVVSGTISNGTALVALAGAIEIIVISTWGLATTYVSERFSTTVRASGFGIGFSLAVVLPSLYAFYMLGLKAFMPYKYTQIVLLVLGGLLTVVGALLGPETKDIDLSLS